MVFKYKSRVSHQVAKATPLEKACLYVPKSRCIVLAAEEGRTGHGTRSAVNYNNYKVSSYSEASSNTKLRHKKAAPRFYYNEVHLGTTGVAVLLTPRT